MKLMAIDGNSILNRAFYGVRLLSNKDGVFTNAIFGFLNIFLKLLKEHSPDAVAVAFDVSRKTFRHEQYALYKANRHGMPEELRMQLPLIQEILAALGYAVVGCEGFEGDDILGTLSSACEQNGEDCVVVSGDRDCLQLVTDKVSVELVRTKDNTLYTPEIFFAEYGFSPEHMIDLKGLMGDSSDNIPGVKGIGEKTAKALLLQYGSIEALYALPEEEWKVTPSVRKKLIEGREQALLSMQLATIVKNAPVETALSAYVPRECDRAEAGRLFQMLELNSFYAKFGIDPVEQAEQTALSIDAPSVSLAAGELPSILKGARLYLLYGANGDLLISDGAAYARTAGKETDSALSAVFSSDSAVYTFGAKPLYKAARRLGFDKTRTLFDAELAAYLLKPDAKTYDLTALALSYLPELTADVPEELRSLALLPELCGALYEQLCAQGMDTLFNEIELPLCEVLADMEYEGFAVNRESVTEFGKMLDEGIAEATEEIYRLAGRRFNINSTRELGEILFEELNLPAGKKTKTGYSTSAEVLEEIAALHEIVPAVLEYRKLTKLSSTYVTGLLKVIAEDGRVHSTFNQTETRTGRISSSEPNVQNIPVRTRLGSEMRRFFVAREGYVLVDADYSQIELRILAHIAADENMIRAFNEKADIHTETAAQVFGLSADMVPPELRSRAKAINFGIVYGIGAYSLSRQINVPVYQAKEYIQSYLETYSGVAAYQRNIVESARRDGYIKTMFGRRREVLDIYSKNKNVKAFAERVALNTPVQGTAADIIKLAMIRVCRRIRDERLHARLVLQVHDELIVEAREDDAQRAAKILSEEMEHAAQLRVKLVADVHIGKNWYEAKQ